MNKIKKNLIKHPVLYALFAVLHHRKDKSYLSMLQKMQNVVEVETKQNNLGLSPVCIFDVKENIGLFAYLRRVTEFLYYCDNMGFCPYIKWTNSDYYDESITRTHNPFEYFYYQPVESICFDSENRALVKYAPGALTMARSFISSNLYEPDREFIIKMGQIEHKYLHMQIDVLTIVETFIKKHDINKCTLGIHIRGTDFRKIYKNHPVFVGPEDYYPFIEEALSSNEFDKIFLATDDEEILEEFINHFKNINIVYSEEVVRGKGILGIHKEAAFSNDISPYKEGINALCDVYSLATCGGFISGVSHVSMFSRIIKSGKNESFSVDRIISKGVHKKGINAAREKFKGE